MKQFDYTEKWKKLLTPEIVSYLTTIHEYKGKQYGCRMLVSDEEKPTWKKKL